MTVPLVFRAEDYMYSCVIDYAGGKECWTLNVVI